MHFNQSEKYVNKTYNKNTAKLNIYRSFHIFIHISNYTILPIFKKTDESN